VIVWRDIKGDAKSTQGRSVETEARTLMISLRCGDYKVKGIMDVHDWKLRWRKFSLR